MAFPFHVSGDHIDAMDVDKVRKRPDLINVAEANFAMA